MTLEEIDRKHKENREIVQLLLIDLYARIPYGVQVLLGDSDHPETLVASNYERLYFNGYNSGSGTLPKPYLRPMTSMTEREKKLYDSMFIEMEGNNFAMFPSAVIDFLNKHHFDYRGLIEKGLALKAPDNMYLHFGDMDVEITVEYKGNKI